MLFKGRFPKPVTRLQQVLLQVAYIGALEQLLSQTGILFQLSQKPGLDGLILTEFVQVITQQLFGCFRLLEMALGSIQQQFHHLDVNAGR